MNSDTAQTDYSSPNDLDFEMSDEQEKAFVDQVLNNVEASEAPEIPVEPVVEIPVETPVVPETPQVAETPVETPVEVVPAILKTDDLFIEVERVIVDDLGEESFEKIKLVYDPEHPDDFIPDGFKAKNDKQLAQILESKSEMAALYSGRKAELDKTEADKAQTAATEASQKAQLDAWDAEIADLIEIGSLPKPALKPGDAGYLEDPSIKQTDAVFQFMTKTNADRVEKGIAPIRSFGIAFAMYQKDAETVAAAEALERENAEVKAKGALVGGSSAPSAGGKQESYVSGSAANIWEVPIK